MFDDQSELFTQVDEFDNVIGSISRKAAHGNKAIIHRSVGILVLNTKNEVLFQKRSALKDKNPGMWSLSAGGHVTYGDDYQAAAERELLEELGVQLPLTYISKNIMYMPTETEFTAFFKAQFQNEKIVTAKDEIDEIKWVPIDKLSDFIHANPIDSWAIDSLTILKYL